MTKINRRLTILGIGAGLVSACGDLEIAESNKPEPRGGLGGTGIVGTVTDFSSLMLNGLRVVTPEDLVVTSALGSLTVGDLAIGHNLTVEATTEANVLTARRVHLAHPVIGRVRNLAQDGRSARIAGVRVELDPGAIGQLELSKTVAVSGAWRNDHVVASRVDQIAAETPDVIAGEVKGINKDRLAIGGQTLLIGENQRPLVGGYSTVTGRLTEEGFLVESLVEGRFTGAAGPLKSLSVEGYLEASENAPFYALSGLGHSFDREARLAALEDDRAVFSGDYIGTFKVQSALRLPTNFADRRALLRQVNREPQSTPLATTR
ncbi:MAG: hypothetical protein AAGC81_11580 [Pseudomonadota bacterium]